MKKGITTIITGKGKGKTTSALGMALRAAGWNYQVLIVQFMKKGEYGEIKALRKIDQVTVKQFGRRKLVDLRSPDQEDRDRANKALHFTRQAIQSRRYDQIILDEINLAYAYQLINKNSVIELIKNRPKDLDLVLTGRGADPKLIKLADQVSEIADIKHPFSKGKKGRRGYEL